MEPTERRLNMLRNTLILVAMSASLTACNYVDPCKTLAPPTPVEIQAATGGSEVEREIGRTECVVQGNTWVNGANLED